MIFVTINVNILNGDLHLYLYNLLSVDNFTHQKRNEVQILGKIRFYVDNYGFSFSQLSRVLDQ